MLLSIDWKLTVLVLHRCECLNEKLKIKRVRLYSSSYSNGGPCCPKRPPCSMPSSYIASPHSLYSQCKPHSSPALAPNIASTARTTWPSPSASQSEPIAASTQSLTYFSSRSASSFHLVVPHWFLKGSSSRKGGTSWVSWVCLVGSWFGRFLLSGAGLARNRCWS